MKEILPEDVIFQRLVRQIRALLESAPGCHDWDHTCRVLANARHLAEAEVADLRIVCFSALLHDIGRVEEMVAKGKFCHAELGARRVPALLTEAGETDSAFIEQVVHCVRAHRYRSHGNERPQTLESRVIYDADKLDAIGAIGLGRAFHFAGRTGARLHNSSKEALSNVSYSREDTAYREYLVKLRHLREAMLTCAGRQAAEQRHRFMQDFFRELHREIKGLS